MAGVSELLRIEGRDRPIRLEQTANHMVTIDVATAVMTSAYMRYGLAPPKTIRTAKSYIKPKARRPVGGAQAAWFVKLMETTLVRVAELASAFREPVEAVQSEQREAFELLLRLTPFENHLRALVRENLTEAFRELSAHLDAFGTQLATRAISSPVPEPSPTQARSEAERPDAAFQEVRDKLIKQSGGVLSLAEAAAQLDVTKQAVHKRIHSKSALGMLLDDRIVLPSLQLELVSDGGKSRIIPGINKVVKAFAEAGDSAWGALQFLVEANPNLARQKPIEALRTGRIAEVEHAARAYLGLDEG